MTGESPGDTREPRAHARAVHPLVATIALALFAILGFGSTFLVRVGCHIDSGTQPDQTLCEALGAYSQPGWGARYLAVSSVAFLVVAVGVVGSRIRQSRTPFWVSVLIAVAAVAAPLVAASVLPGHQV
jgi:hypothetical protein